MKSDIVLATCNAKYGHPSLGLRCLLANMGELRVRAVLVEFDLRIPVAEMTETIAEHRPAIVGFGIHIWNALLMAELVEQIKSRLPDAIIVLGGPEISHETELQPVAASADYVVCGEADLAFPALCRSLLAGNSPAERIIRSAPPNLKDVSLPYTEYTDDDLAHRLTYVETTRGCPFKCDYCLSSLDNSTRCFPTTEVLKELQCLIGRGARRLKFVDRTFNLDTDHSLTVMNFLLQELQPDLQVHFEMIPSRFPAELRAVIKKFPADSLRLEIGVQSFNEEVCHRINRRQDNEEIEEILDFLHDQTHALVHADLIAGLPGESLNSFAEGFDRLVSHRPAEIQVGILKLLRGTRLERHTDEWGIVYNPRPPYDIVRNRLISADDITRIKRFARYWQIIGNSGRFRATTPLIWEEGAEAFSAFMRISDWLFARFGATHGIALEAMAEALLEYLMSQMKTHTKTAADALWLDYGQSHHNRISRRLDSLRNKNS